MVDTSFVHKSVVSFRPKLREKVVKGAEILEVLHSLPDVYEYLFSLTNCHYATFFQNLALVEQKIKMDRYLYQVAQGGRDLVHTCIVHYGLTKKVHLFLFLFRTFWRIQHYRFYVREMRVLAYAQLLQSYRSLTLTYMAKAFGVSPDFIDRELARSMLMEMTMIKDVIRSIFVPVIM